ncbi:flavoprotein [Kitasatospora sp. NPDC057015]|uniref:flavoprotein n=1 Tax=Kitasatospora sp. NPDC057015 TaxID=3346001 RepID=UPI003641DE58
MPSDRVLHLLGSAAEPVLGVRRAVERAQARGWEVCLGLTATAADWLADDLPALEALTGHRVKQRYRRPGDPEVWPAPNAVLLAPATFNTLNSWALGITDSWVVGFASEAIGKGVPLAAAPCVNGALVAHPQFGRSLATLRAAGVLVLPTPEGSAADAAGPTLPPGEEPGAEPPGFDWESALDAAERAVERAVERALGRT